MHTSRHAPRIGLALSGGTLKAAAHIGVLDVLLKLGIEPDFVAGTSAGSFVAALFAHGYTINDMKQLVHTFPGPRLLDYGFPLLSSLANLARYRLQSLFHTYTVLPLPNGLLRGKQLESYFRNKFKHRKPTKPYAVVATDLNTGNPVVFTNEIRLTSEAGIVQTNDIIAPLCGSCALPGVLTPVRLQSWLLADGGLRFYIPVQILRQAGCDKIIVVNLNKLEEKWEPRTFVHIIERSFEILLQETTADDLEGNDVFLLEPDVSNITWVSFHELKSCLHAGERIVTERQSDLLKFLSGSPPVESRPVANLPKIKLRPMA